MAKRSSKLRVARGERYALVPEEVMESDAYRAQTDWARVVLYALACRYHGHNNGDLSLPIAEAKRLGVTAPWKLYAGLRLLERSDLIFCTRRGRLERGTKVCSLYAITWRGIDACDQVVYDSGIKACPIPSHAWAKWKKPDDWTVLCKQIARSNHGRGKNPVSTTLGNGRSTTLGTEAMKTDQPCWGKETSLSDHTVVDTSKNLAGGYQNGRHGRGANNASAPISLAPKPSGKNGGALKIEKLMRLQSHLPDAEIARICQEPVDLVAQVRRSLEMQR